MAGMDIVEWLQAQAQRVNEIERRARREYHAHLLASGDRSQTLNEHLAAHADFAALGPPATEAELARLQALCSVPLPPALLDFYRRGGGFAGGARLQQAVIHAPAELLRAAEAPEGPWHALPSLGLVDMIRWAWGNDRFEFDPASGEGLDQASIEALNARYAIVARRELDEGEAFEFLFVDGDGGCGRLFYHQDAFDELLADDLQPMLRSPRTGGPARGEFTAVLAAFIAAAAA